MAGKLIVFTVCALLLAACGGSDQRSGAVRFLVFGEPAELQAYRNLIREFGRVEPDVSVQLVTASDRDDLLARLATSFAGGTPPDIFLINYRFFGQFAARGVLEPLGERLEASDAFRLDDFFPQAVDAFRFRDTLYCLPQNISSLVVYFNRDLFRERGVPEPREGWSWQDMVLAAQQLTRPAARGQAAVYGLGVEPTLIRLAPFVWSAGGELVDDFERPTRLTLDTPPAQRALQEFMQLRLGYRVIAGETEHEAEDDELRFLNGRLGMILSSRRSTPTFRSIEGFDWDVAPLPQFERPATILHSDAYCMPKASERKDDAWRFVEFALGEDGQRITAATGRTVPSLKSVASSPAFLDPEAKPRNSAVFVRSIGAIRRVPSISTWPEIEDAAEPILEQALYEGAGGAAQVAERLDRATRPIFARAEG